MSLVKSQKSQNSLKREMVSDFSLKLTNSRVVRKVREVEGEERELRGDLIAHFLTYYRT